MASPKKKPDTKLSLKEVADSLGENLETVRTWRKAGRFPNADLVDTPRGPVWLVPLSDLATFQKPVAGRPAKPNATSKRSKT